MKTVVSRPIQGLELQHREREAALEREVRTATGTLLEQQRSLARAERLAATGELAASMAHELRSPLAGIQMSLANLREEIAEPELAERLGMVVEEVVRLGRLMNELVQMARHVPEAPSRVELADLVDPLQALIRYQLPAGVRLETCVQEGLCCRVPKQRLRQALLNLVLNAAKAIGDGEGVIAIDLRRQREGIRITVEDDGPGFPPELLESGIRPFYSTRARGAGLGLAMVRRFVSEAEGSIELANRSDRGERRGARVTLLLPSVVDHV